MSEITGSCLCGQVQYSIRPPYMAFQNCFCSRCRKTSGSAHGSNIILPPDQFSWLAGESEVGRYEIPEAQHFATSFCKRCGSSLPWLTQRGTAVVVPAGTLDTLPDATPTQNIFWDSHAAWYRLPDQLETYPTVPGKSEPTEIKRGKY